MSNSFNFFESMRMLHGVIPLLSDHYHRIASTAQKFHLQLGFDFEKFETSIFNSVREFQLEHARIRISFLLEKEILSIGKINVEPFTSKEYNPSEGLSLCLYKDGRKPLDLLSNCKVTSKLLYEDSILYAESRDYDQSIILNENDEIVETSRCNLFLIQNNQIYTPPLSSGAVDGIQRKRMFSHFPIIEKKIYIHELPDYSELFLTNAVRGVMKVNKLGNKNLSSEMTEKIQKSV